MKSVHLSGVTASRRRCASCVRPPGPELLETLRTNFKTHYHIKLEAILVVANQSGPELYSARMNGGCKVEGYGGSARRKLEGGDYVTRVWSCVHPSRREFLTVAATAAGLTAGSCGAAQVGGQQATPRADAPLLVGDGRKRRILLRGGVVLTLDPKVGDFEKADVLIDGKKIAAVGADVLRRRCRGRRLLGHDRACRASSRRTIISTRRCSAASSPDGLLQGAWPQETYGSVVQNIWTAGRIADPAEPDKVIWDLGRVPYDPEDCYISQLVACLSEISQGITTGTDTSQANHTPEHTDAMIKGLMESGRRMVFAYSGGTNRSAQGIPFEFPGATNDTTKGIGRIAKTYFSSKDQLVTLGFAGGPAAAFAGARYTGWQLGRSFGASIHNHVVGNPMAIVNAAADARNGTDWSDVTFIHALDGRTRLALRSVMANRLPGQQPIESVGDLPRPRRPCFDRQPHRDADAARDAAVSGGAQSRHPAQPEPGRRHEHDDRPVLADARSVLSATRSGQRPRVSGEQPRRAAGTATGDVASSDRDGHYRGCSRRTASWTRSGRSHRGRKRTSSCSTRDSINTWPMNNVPGTIVTMMNPSHVRDVLIAGKVVYWKRQLVGWDVDRLLRQIEQARDRVLARINGPAKVGTLPQGSQQLQQPVPSELPG